MKAAALAKKLELSPQGRSEWAQAFGLLETHQEAVERDVAEHTVLQDLKRARLWGLETKLAFNIARDAIDLEYDGPLFLVVRSSGDHEIFRSDTDLAAAVSDGSKVRILDLRGSIARARRIWQAHVAEESLSESPDGRQVTDLEKVRRRRAAAR